MLCSCIPSDLRTPTTGPDPVWGLIKPFPFLESVERPCLAILLWVVEYKNLEQKSEGQAHLCDTLSSSVKQRFENQILSRAVR